MPKWNPLVLEEEGEAMARVLVSVIIDDPTCCNRDVVFSVPVPNNGVER